MNGAVSLAGRFVDGAAGAALGSGAFTLLDPGSDTVSPPYLALDNDNACLVWSRAAGSGQVVQGAYLTMSPYAVQDYTAFTISGTTDIIRANPVAALTAAHLLTAWDTNGEDVFARLLSVDYMPVE